MANDIDQLCINTIRTLSMDAVQAANSGHPGTPMALSPVGHTVWTKFLRYDPAAPDWPNRDRFVLSVGHASMLLYALIHLAGVEEIDVFAEVTENEIAVFVRDRGAGFDPAAVPEDRHGIAESIRGRLERAGGSASVVSTPGEGTEVELRIPRCTP